MHGHITAVGALRIGSGILGLLLAALVLFLFVGIGALATALEGDEEALAVLTLIAAPFAVVLTVLSALSIVGGIGVLKHANWARYLTLVLSVLDLFNFPLGTVLGIYCLWVLAQDRTASLFVARPAAAVEA